MHFSAFLLFFAPANPQIHGGVQRARALTAGRTRDGRRLYPTPVPAAPHNPGSPSIALAGPFYEGNTASSIASHRADRVGFYYKPARRPPHSSPIRHVLQLLFYNPNTTLTQHQIGGIPRLTEQTGTSGRRLNVYFCAGRPRRGCRARDPVRSAAHGQDRHAWGAKEAIEIP